MSYHYFDSKNKLVSVQKNGGLPYNYVYDSKGNLTSDQLKQVSSVQYDYRNLPLSLSSHTGQYFYDYDDSGQRVRKYGSSDRTNYQKQYYLRDQTGRELAVYRNNGDTLAMVNLYGNDLIGRVNVNYQWVWVHYQQIGGGSSNPSGGDSSLVYSRIDERKYYFKDHLGSIRTVVDKNGNILSAQDYYPYGGILRSYSTGGNSINDRYRFTQKERDQETGYDYFGARFYDSELGRWVTPDPLADKYPGWSPYNYCLGNPLRLIDSDGREIGGPELIAGASAGALEVSGLVLLGTAAVLDVAGYDNTGWLNSTGNKLTEGAENVLDVFTSARETPHTQFPVTEGEGINKTTIAPSDNTTVPIKFDAKDQTFNGRPTDKNGNVLGGSGKPLVKTKTYSSEKKAKDAARNSGKGQPIKHTSSKKGDRHYHSTDKDGKKIPNGTHYIF